MEPLSKRARVDEDQEDGEIGGSDDETMKSSTPKKSIYTAGIELINQGPKTSTETPSTTTTDEANISPKTQSGPSQSPNDKSENPIEKRKSSCPIILPFLPPGLPALGSLPMPPIPLPVPVHSKDHPTPVKLPELPKKDELTKAYEAVYSDDNISDVDESSTHETATEPETATLMENGSDEMQKTVLELQTETKDRSFEVYTKEVVKHRGGSWIRNTEPLPEGWTIVSHHCGFPLYFHKDTRVITWSRPYYIGSASVKNHKVPLAAIPCLAYSRKEELFEENDKKSEPEPKSNEESKDKNQMCPLDSIDAQLVKTDTQAIQSAELKEYISKRFEYQEVTSKKYRDHDAFKQHLKHKKERRKAQKENRKESADPKNKDEEMDEDLPSIAKNYIEVRAPEKNGTGTKTISIYISGKTTVTVLNEYCSRALRCTPNYDQVETPSEMVHKDFKTYRVRLPDGNTYGTGSGPNVQAAKNVAALETLKILIKGFEPDDKHMLTGRAEKDMAYFDHVKIKDKRIHQLSQQVGLTPPYQFFMDIQHKLQGPQCSEALDIHVYQDESKGGSGGSAHWTFKFQGKELKGSARSKKNGKHIAAQHMLAELNPDLTTWGQILKKYNTFASKKDRKDKNNDEETITQLFKEKTGPNQALLKKLREMMKKVSQEQNSFLTRSDHIQPLFTEKRSEIPIDNGRDTS